MVIGPGMLIQLLKTSLVSRLGHLIPLSASSAWKRTLHFSKGALRVFGRGADPPNGTLIADFALRVATFSLQRWCYTSK